jgi:anti-sigma regulatory factor (Ser/Thr protein kinase)
VRRDLRLVARASEVKPALERLEGWLREADLPDHEVLEARLLAEEVLTNVVKYGGEPGKECRIEAELTTSPEAVFLVFRDDGRPFDPLAAPAPDLGRPAAERPLGGLGLVLVRALVPQARYAREAEWNVLRLTRPRRP